MGEAADDEIYNEDLATDFGLRPDNRLTPAPQAERKFAVSTAGFWFMAARKYQAAGDMRSALVAMENAFNHTENALYAARRDAPVTPDQQA